MQRHIVFPWYFQHAGAEGGGGGGTAAGSGASGAAGSASGSGGEGADRRRSARESAFSNEDVEAIVEERLAKARRTWEKQFGGPGAIDELDRLRREEADRKRKEEEAKGNYERALASAEERWTSKEKSWLDERGTLLGKLREKTVRGAIIALSAERAYKPDQIADLLERRVQLDEAGYEPKVLGPDGKPAFVGGKPMTIDQLVNAFLDDNPHLAKAANTGGAGGAQGGASTADGGQHGAAAGTAGSREIVEARERYEKAREQAEKMGGAAEITAAHKAKRDLDKLEAAAAARR